MFLIQDQSLEPEKLSQATAEMAIEEISWADRESIPTGARVFVYLGDEQVRELLLLAVSRQWEVGLLPHPKAKNALSALEIKGDLGELLLRYQDCESVGLELLTCNDEVVFGSVVIGRVLALRPDDINRPQTNWSVFLGAFKGLTKLRLNAYTLITGKERTIRLAALGLLVAGHTHETLAGRKVAQDVGIGSGRFSTVALAPRSIISYLIFMLRMLIPNRLDLLHLPSSLALIQSHTLQIQTPRGTEYLLDGKPVHSADIEFRILDDKLRMLPGLGLEPAPEESATHSKETVRLNHVPADDGATPLIDAPLPFFSHASEEEYRELFVSLRDNATLTPSFQVLMILSMLLALTGLYANSAPVIIGAMILAPLMSPIVSLAMGLARTEISLIHSSLRTLLVGVAWGLVCAVLLAWAVPLEIPTSEMRARMSPTLLDLMVAVVSGVAGAYASAKEEIAKSLAGVAIAVALVPPLSVAGIGLGWGDWEMARGAFLLLITNLVGISLAASITFLVMGFAPFHRAKKGLGFSLVILLAISVPLYIAFEHLVLKDHIRKQVPTGVVRLLETEVHVGHVEVSVGEPHLVRVILSSPNKLNEAHVDALKELIGEEVGAPIQLEAQLNIRR